jgi:hypothetical protein
MKESFSKPPNKEEAINLIKEHRIALIRELAESNEQFPFPGIDRDVRDRLKAEEVEFPGYTTPIEELIERFRTEGLKVVLGTDKNTEVFILPSGSNDVGMDGLFPRHLVISEGMDLRLKELILTNKQLAKELGKI